jgi:hypothetical protein
MEGNGVLLLRCWMEIMHIWMNYITRSPEHPIGESDQFLFRMELQDAKANLPHVHALLWTKDELDTEEGLHKALDRIRGFIGDIIRPEEREKFKTMGVFEDDVAIETFLCMVQPFLTHTHTRRCLYTPKPNDEGEEQEPVFRCKANNNRRDNPSPSEHSFVDIPVKHSPDAIDVLVMLGLGTKDDGGNFIPLHKSLVAVKHYPPAHGDEGIISPVFAGLLPLNPNMGNAQFASGYTLSRYLAKYIVSIDMYNTIKISPPQNKDEPNTFNVEGEELPNQKITGNRIQQEARVEKEKPSDKTPNTREGRAFNVVEYYMLLCGYAPVITNIEFKNVPTKPFDKRSGRDRKAPCEYIQTQTSLQNIALTPMKCLPSHIVRQHRQLPQWRQFLPTQVQVAYDDLQSPVSTSTVTSFGVRSPELMFAARQQDYSRWFVGSKNRGTVDDMLQWCNLRILQEYSCSSWIDGFNNEIRVRAAAVPAVIKCLQEHKCLWFEGYDPMLRLFQEIKEALMARGSTSDRQEQLVRMYVTKIANPKLPVVWFQLARPTFNTKFLIHLLLSLGFIKDEYDLFGTSDLRQCFINAGLLDSANPELSATNLSKTYVIEQLAGIPKGTATFDRYLVAAHNTITDLFLHNQLFTETLPLALYCRVRENTDAQVEEFSNTRTTNLVRSILAQMRTCGFEQLPTEAECINATFGATVAWHPMQSPQGAGQPQESYDEQRGVLRLACELIDKYKSAPSHYTKGLCHVGAGGVGKTLVLYTDLLYGRCQGLKVGITAINSERAQELAGVHIHELFGFQGRGMGSSKEMGEKACVALLRNPVKMEYLQTLDILGVDEAGAIPCELLAAMCHVLRYVRNNSLPFGGVLILATMDYLQLEPVLGRHPLMSPAFTACFYF